MKQLHTPLKMIFGAVVAAALAVVDFSASAQTATTSPTKAGNLTTAATRPTSATAQMIQEACQRAKARRAKFLLNGTPEQFGSEEPFTFDPTKPCP
jgi:hypothetical protein